jgi:hypothetical protein
MKAKAIIMKLPIWHIISSKTLFFILATILVTIFGLYAYLVNKTIMNVVSRQNTEQSISNLSTTIGELEYKYMTLRNGITIDYAYTQGFHDSVASQFITRGPSTLSYNSQ